MIVLKGTGVFKDIAFGTLLLNEKNKSGVEKYIIKDLNQEVERYYQARNMAVKEVRCLYEKSLADFGASEAEIFAIHEMMIKDNDFEITILDIIKGQCLNAEYSVWEASKKFSEIFSNMDDEYMSQRASDVQDISTRIINCLSRSEKESCDGNFSCDSNVIIGAEDLIPSEVSCFDKQKIKGFVTSKGSTYSHASIISKVLKIPGIVSLNSELKPEYNGKKIIIDSFTGTLYIDPDLKTLEEFKVKKAKIDEKRELLQKLKGKKNITLDGKNIDIYANLNNPQEIEEVLESDAGGIGLFRSEFFYLNRDSYPTEEELFEVYKGIVQKMEGKPVIIRTLDVGSDKRVDYFNLPQEHNPAMGYRGIRICLDRPALFMIQLRAIYRASAFGNVSIMFPMIISIDEIVEIKKIIEKVKASLQEDNLEFSDNVPIGVMIETAAAVFLSKELAKEVDFFSIGTNDLTQYSLAIDRQNSYVSKKFDSRHKSIIRMIKMVVENAHEQGIKVGICGEAAADEALTEKFLALGIDELSMTPSSVLEIRKKVMETNVYDIYEETINDI